MFINKSNDTTIGGIKKDLNFYGAIISSVIVFSMLFVKYITLLPMNFISNNEANHYTLYQLFYTFVISSKTGRPDSKYIIAIVLSGILITLLVVSGILLFVFCSSLFLKTKKSICIGNWTMNILIAFTILIPITVLISDLGIVTASRRWFYLYIGMNWNPVIILAIALLCKFIFIRKLEFSEG